MKKPLIFVLLLFWGILIFAGNDFLRNKLQKDLVLESVALPDVLAALSKEYRGSLSCDKSAGDVVVDLSFPRGTTLEEVIQSLTSAHNLKRKQVGNTLILSKKIKEPAAEVTLAGVVTSPGLKNGLPGVKISVLKSHAEQALSVTGGNFTVTDINPGVYVVRFEKEGYVPKGEIVNLEGNKTDLRVVLERDAAYAPEAGPKAGGGHSSRAQVTVIDGAQYYTEQVKLFRMPASEMKEILESTYEGLLRATPVEKINSVILFGRKEVVESAKKVIQNLDGDLKQVRVSSEILDVSDNLFTIIDFIEMNIKYAINRTFSLSIQQFLNIKFKEIGNKIKNL
jgi:general secretion pathway protein D